MQNPVKLIIGLRGSQAETERVNTALHERLSVIDSRRAYTEDKGKN